MSIKSLAALALTLTLSSGAALAEDKKCGAGSCAKKEKTAEGEKDAACSKKDGGCSKKDAACSKKEAGCSKKEAGCSKKEAAPSAQ
jgi:hypothetical protein